MRLLFNRTARSSWQAFPLLVRYNSDGTLDTTFGKNGIVTNSGVDLGMDLVIQPDAAGQEIIVDARNGRSKPKFRQASEIAQGNKDPPHHQLRGRSLSRTMGINKRLALTRMPVPKTPASIADRLARFHIDLASISLIQFVHAII